MTTDKARVALDDEDRRLCRHREITGDDARREWACVRCGKPFVPAYAADVAHAIGFGYREGYRAGNAEWDGWTSVRTERLNVQPEDVAEPIGRIRRTWWRLGWLSAQAVARDPAPLAKLREVGR